MRQENHRVATRYLSTNKCNAANAIVTYSYSSLLLKNIFIQPSGRFSFVVVTKSFFKVCIRSLSDEIYLV